jgi:imidazolonepropionase
MEVDLIIYGADQLLTIGGYEGKRRTGDAMSDLGIVSNGAVAIKDGRIVRVGKTEEVKRECALAENGREIDARCKTVMPGFVDCHTHLIVYGTREDELKLRMAGVSGQEIRNRGGGIYKSVRLTRGASWWELMCSVRKTLDRMLLHGTTTVEARSSYGLGLLDDIKSLEVAKALNQTHVMDLVPTFQGAHVISPDFRDNPDGYVELIVNEVLPEIGRRKLAKLCDVGCEDGGLDDSFDVEQARAILIEAKRQGLVPRVGSELTPGGVKLAIDVGAVSVEHVSSVTEDLIIEMAAHNVGANLLPASEFASMSGRYTDPRQFIDNGVPVAIGTNFNPGSYCESMQMAIRIGCFEMKMSPEEVLVASTINAAHVLGVASEVGSLEVGKKADIIILDAPSYLHIPYQFGVNLVETVIKRGQVVAEAGRIVV